jgi:Flp pilus assembly pilin Flp
MTVANSTSPIGGLMIEAEGKAKKLARGLGTASAEADCKCQVTVSWFSANSRTVKFEACAKHAMNGEEKQKAAAARRKRDEDGAAAVEFALVMPILLWLVFGIISFGAVFAQYLAISNAARQAARFGSVADRTCDNIVAEARSASTTIGLKGSDVVVTVTRGSFSCTGGPAKPCEGSVEGDSVKVTVANASRVLVPIPPLPSVINIQGEGQFRCEFS